MHFKKKKKCFASLIAIIRCTFLMIAPKLYIPSTTNTQVNLVVPVAIAFQLSKIELILERKYTFLGQDRLRQKKKNSFHVSDCKHSFYSTWKISFWIALHLGIQVSRFFGQAKVTKLVNIFLQTGVPLAIFAFSFLVCFD